MIFAGQISRGLSAVRHTRAHHAQYKYAPPRLSRDDDRNQNVNCSTTLSQSSNASLRHTGRRQTPRVRDVYAARGVSSSGPRYHWSDPSATTGGSGGGGIVVVGGGGDIFFFFCQNVVRALPVTVAEGWRENTNYFLFSRFMLYARTSVIKVTNAGRESEKKKKNTKTPRFACVSDGRVRRTERDLSDK